MREFFIENQKLLICTALGLVAGLLLGLALPPLFGGGPQDAELTPVDRIGVVNVLPETRLHFSYEFSGCAHKVERSPDALPYVGETREEFQAEHPGARIEHFSAEQIALSWLLIGACPQHVMLKADEVGQLHILQTNAETMEVESIQALTLYTNAFDVEIAEELYEGIVFETVSEVNEYLENAES